MTSDRVATSGLGRLAVCLAVAVQGIDNKGFTVSIERRIHCATFIYGTGSGRGVTSEGGRSGGK